MFMYSATAGMSGTKPIVSVLDEVKDGTQDVMLELKYTVTVPVCWVIGR